MTQFQDAEDAIFGSPKDPTNNPSMQGVSNLFQRVAYIYPDFAAFKASANTYTAGEFVGTAKEGFSYKAVDSNPDVSNAGLQGFEVQEGPNGVRNVLAFGALSDGSNAYAELNTALSNYDAVLFPAGEFGVGTQRLGEYQDAKRIVGVGSESLIRILSDNSDDTAFRIGAVGAGQPPRAREFVSFEDLVFLPPSSATSPIAYTGIDAQSTYPLYLKNIVFDGMGADAFKSEDNFYGYGQGCRFVGSGATFDEVNNMTMVDFEFRPKQSADDPSQGGDDFGDVGKYPYDATASDNNMFIGSIFEGWECPAIRLSNCSNTIFQGTWFERLVSTTHVMKLERVYDVTFDNCHLDFGFAYTDSFAHVDNTGDPRDATRMTYANINGGYLSLTSTGFGNREEFVTVANSEPVTVRITNTTFGGGLLFGGETVEFDVRSGFLSRDVQTGFYTRSNAMVMNSYNSWMPLSANTDWDYTTSIGWSQIFSGGHSALTIARTSVDGEYMTGTQGIKVGGIPIGAVNYAIQRSLSSFVGAVSTEGETYYCFGRIKPTQDLELQYRLNHGSSEYGFNKTIRVQANRWTDIVLKTSEATTWSLGQGSAPNLKFVITNNSGVAADLFIDREDYSIVFGDVEF